MPDWNAAFEAHEAEQSSEDGLRCNHWPGQRRCEICGMNEPEPYTMEWARKVMAEPISRADHIILARAQADVAVQMLAGDDPDLAVALMLMEEARVHIRTAQEDFHSPDHIEARERHNSEKAYVERMAGNGYRCAGDDTSG